MKFKRIDSLEDVRIGGWIAWNKFVMFIDDKKIIMEWKEDVLNQERPKKESQ